MGLYDVVTAGEVQQLYGLSPAAVRKAIKEGRLLARKSGGTWLCLRSDADMLWGERKRRNLASETISGTDFKAR